MKDEFSKIPLRLPVRAMGLAALTWLPLLFLSLIEGIAIGGTAIPFLYDIATIARFLVAVPILVFSELPIGRRLNGVIRYMREADLVQENEREAFDASVSQAFRTNCSRIPDLVLLVITYVFVYARSSNAHLPEGQIWFQENSWAAFYYLFVSLPIFYFLLLRWGFRLAVWIRFLWQVSKLRLALTPDHPDGSAGIGLLGKSSVPFGNLLFALSCVVSGAIAGRVLYTGARLEDFAYDYAGLIVLSLLLLIVPLLPFIPRLIRTKQEGLTQFGILAGHYTQQFDAKWVTSPTLPRESLLGSADIQSMADLASVVELVRGIRVIPMELKDFASIVLLGVLPALPLALLVIPVSEILKGVLRLLG